VRRSDTENTFVGSLSHPLTDAQANDLAIELKQEAIPQRSNGVGSMHGPQKDKWGPFSPKHFLEPTPAKTSTTITSKKRAAVEASARETGANVSRSDLLDNNYEVGQRRKAAAAVLTRPAGAIDLQQLRANSLLDRGLIDRAMAGHPGVQQTPMLRDVAKTAKKQAEVEKRAEEVFSGKNLDLLRAQIKRGQEMGGATYYPSTFPLRARAEELGASFSDLIAANAGTSPQNKLANNFASMSLVHYAARRGITAPADVVALGQRIAKQRGHLNFFLSGGHVRNVNELKAGTMTGFDSGQKVAAYHENLSGNFLPKTLDTHEAAGASIGTKHFPFYHRAGGFSSPEYGAFERGYQSLAEPLGISQGAVQPGRWYGGGDLTGLSAAPGDFLSTMEHVVQYSAEHMGYPTTRSALQKYIDQIIMGDEMLVPYYPTKGAKMPPLKGKIQKGFITPKMAAALAGGGSAVVAAAPQVHSLLENRH
jgi:hypothetical protein